MDRQDKQDLLYLYRTVLTVNNLSIQTPKSCLSCLSMFESVSPFIYPCQTSRITALSRPFLLPPVTVIIFYRTRKPILDRTPETYP